MKNTEWVRWLLLLLLALIWGSSFILIRSALVYFSPTVVGSLRVGIAGLVLLPIALFNFKKIPKNKWVWVFLSGLLGNFIPMFLFPVAQTQIASSTAGILNSLVPVFVLILGFFLFQQTYKWRQVVGIILGFLGAFFLIQHSNDSSGETNPWGFALLVVLATAMYAASGLIIKKHLTNIPSLSLSSVVFAIWLLPTTGLFLWQCMQMNWHAEFFPYQGLPYVGLLGVLGTAAAMVLFYKLIQISSAVFASSVTYLMPLVAVFWGFIFGESLGWGHLFSGAIILVGVYLIRDREKI